MRLHAEITMIDGGESTLMRKSVKWMILSLAGFLFWSAVIAAVRYVVMH